MKNPTIKIRPEIVTQRFFVPGPLPSLNEIVAAAKGYNGRGFAYHKMKAEWGELVLQEITKAKITPVKQCQLAFLWRESGKRRDPDNIVCGRKFILDALVKAGVLENDGWTQVLAFNDTWVVDKDNPGVLVELHS